jgi:thiosulfate/3-mercaptopyruvate sulfurtransferase
MLEEILMSRFALVLTFLLSTAAAAASSRESLLVDTAWLKQHLHDKNLVLLQVGDKESFEEAHIPGARAVTLSDIHTSDHSEKGLMLEMPAADDLRKRLEALGISDDSRIIAYYGKDWVSPTTRIIFTLDYAGLGARTSMLDGGLGAWVKAGGAVTKDATVAKGGRLSPLKLRPLVVDGATVRAKLGTKGFAVVDGRAEVFYDGTEAGEDHGGKQRPGHIRGASSIPFESITDDDLFVKPADDLRAIFAKAGVQPNDTVIGYCHIGQQATLMLFAARILGHPVLLYDGSYQDWSRHADYPVDNPAETR